MLEVYEKYLPSKIKFLSDDNYIKFIFEEIENFLKNFSKGELLYNIQFNFSDKEKLEDYICSLIGNDISVKYTYLYKKEMKDVFIDFFIILPDTKSKIELKIYFGNEKDEKLSFDKRTVSFSYEKNIIIEDLCLEG